MLYGRKRNEDNGFKGVCEACGIEGFKSGWTQGQEELMKMVREKKFDSDVYSHRGKMGDTIIKLSDLELIAKQLTED